MKKYLTYTLFALVLLFATPASVNAGSFGEDIAEDAADSVFDYLEDRADEREERREDLRDARLKAIKERREAVLEEAWRVHERLEDLQELLTEPDVSPKLRSELEKLRKDLRGDLEKLRQRFDKLSKQEDRLLKL